MWSDHVKVKHREERLDTDTHIFFRESKFGDWSAYGVIQGHPSFDAAHNFCNAGRIFCTWYGLSVAKHRSEIPCVSASVAGSALLD